jgi:hypothetical protein
MGWVLLPQPPFAAGHDYQSEGVQLLNDGRILASWLESAVTSWSCVYTPDVNGDYANGTWGPMRDIGAEHHGGMLFLAPDGRVFQMGSHAFASTYTGEYRVSIWNPVTDSWSRYPTDQAGLSHQGRGGLTILDDNRVVMFRGPGGLALLNPLTGEITVDSSIETPSMSEGHLTVTPDGRCFAFMYTGSSVSEFRPQYDAACVAAGSYANGANFQTTTSATITNVPQWPYGSRPVEWFDPGFGTNTEISANMYYYKVGAVVMVGGWAGELLELNPATRNVSCRAVTPPGDYTDSALATWHRGTLSSRHAGQTANEIIAGGTMTVDFTDLLETATPTFVVLPTTNGRWAVISGTPTNLPTLPYRGPYPYSMTFNALSYGTLQTKFGGERNSVIPTNAPVARSVLYQWGVGEGCAAILPSGKYAYIAGTRNITVTSGAGPLFLWDGTTNAPVKQDGIINGAPCRPLSWASHCTLTAKGDLFVQDNARMLMFTETGAAVDAAQKPLIDSIPAYISQGNRHLLVGRQLTGLHVGAAYGDETPDQCNHTLVRLTAADGKVYFCPTTNWSYRGIRPLRLGSVNFTVPTNVPLGTYTLHAIANGVASDPQTVMVVPSQPAEGVFINSYTGF